MQLRDSIVLFTLSILSCSPSTAMHRIAGSVTRLLCPHRPLSSVASVLAQTARSRLASSATHTHGDRQNMRHFAAPRQSIPPLVIRHPDIRQTLVPQIHDSPLARAVQSQVSNSHIASRQISNTVVNPTDHVSTQRTKLLLYRLLEQLKKGCGMMRNNKGRINALLSTLFLLLTAHDVYSENQIVYIIATPGAAKVECLRMLANSGNFKIMHNPANHAYCVVHGYTDITRGWYRDDAPSSYAQAKEEILKEAQRSSVVVAETGHTAIDFLTEYPDLSKSHNARYIFLISHPHEGIISYYEKKKHYFDKVPRSQMSDSVGLQGIYRIYEQLKKANAPILLVRSEDLYFSTCDTVRQICRFLNIPYTENLLCWQDLSDNFVTFPGWYTIELTECAKHWNMKAIKSTGFSRPTMYSIDANNNPTFEEIENQQHKEICLEAYNENMTYYNLLMQK